jgi:cobalt/nickel transport protein
MKGKQRGLIWIGLGISLLLALFLSPFASSHPDGLEKVALTQGFAQKGEESETWSHAPLRDYSFPGIKNSGISTALSGFVGTLAIFFLALGIGTLVKKSSDEGPSCRKK